VEPLVAGVVILGVALVAFRAGRWVGRSDYFSGAVRLRILGD
jgi:hypothetical protein